MFSRPAYTMSASQNEEDWWQFLVDGPTRDIGNCDLSPY